MNWQESPYAAIVRGGESVEYWATARGRVVRRASHPDRPPRIGGWDAGTQAAARSEIDRVVDTRLQAGWSRA